MRADAQLEALENQLAAFKVASSSSHETQQELLEKHLGLIEDYRSLKSDYEEEKSSRERYKKMARGQEKNPFVLVLIDGDGYIVRVSER